jgi:uncharacterized protein (DUF2141 family)
MKYLALILTAIIFLSNSTSAQDTLNTFSGSGNLIIVIIGFENSEGTARIGLSNSEENWNMKDTAYAGMISEIQNDSVRVTFENIPFGEYGVKVHHDENSDDDMDTNFLGIPTENYGFSNNASGTFGPPDWEDAKFLFDTHNQVHEINLDE